MNNANAVRILLYGAVYRTGTKQAEPHRVDLIPSTGTDKLTNVEGRYQFQFNARARSLARSAYVYDPRRPATTTDDDTVTRRAATHR